MATIAAIRMVIKTNPDNSRNSNGCTGDDLSSFELFSKLEHFDVALRVNFFAFWEGRI